MARIELSPYFHPTQIVLVDDDIDFLGNLSLQLDADLAYLLFDSTHKALRYFGQHQSSRNRKGRFFREHYLIGSERMAKDGREHFEIDTEALRGEMQASDRFAQISVALVDYAMPRMDGLEFCKRIQDPHVKKILFTGVATESEAVDAFNQGIIDQYIRKHEHSVYNRLNEAIRSLQHEYLRDVFQAAADAFSLITPALLNEPAVACLIDQLRTSHDLTEYYLSSEPPGFLIATATGRVKQLVIQSRAQFESRAEQARQAGAPDACVRQLWQGKSFLDPAFEATAGADYGDWQAHERPAEVLPGPESELRWALFDVSATHEPSQVRPSYNEFLEWLDTVAYSLM